jgi:hypothetical protein
MRGVKEQQLILGCPQLEVERAQRPHPFRSLGVKLPLWDAAPLVASSPPGFAHG